MNSSQPPPGFMGPQPELQESLLESTAQISQVALIVWSVAVVYGLVVLAFTGLAILFQWRRDAKEAATKRTLIGLFIEGAAIVLLAGVEIAKLLAVETICGDVYAFIIPLIPLIHQTASFLLFYERAKCTEKFWTKCQRFTAHFVLVLLFANIALSIVVATSLSAQVSPFGDCAFRNSNPGIAILMMFVQVLLLALTLALFLLPILSMNQTGKKLDDRLKKLVKRNLKLFLGSLIFPIVFFLYTSSSNGRAATTPPGTPEFWTVIISLQWIPILQGLDILARSVCIRLMTNLWLPKSYRKGAGSKTGTRRPTNTATSRGTKSSASVQPITH